MIRWCLHKLRSLGKYKMTKMKLGMQLRLTTGIMTVCCAIKNDLRDNYEISTHVPLPLAVVTLYKWSRFTKFCKSTCRRCNISVKKLGKFFDEVRRKVHVVFIFFLNNRKSCCRLAGAPRAVRYFKQVRPKCFDIADRKLLTVMRATLVSFLHTVINCRLQRMHNSTYWDRRSCSVVSVTPLRCAKPQNKSRYCSGWKLLGTQNRLFWWGPYPPPGF